MKLTRCENGHFFDQDRYPTCPHCGTANVTNDNPTVSLTQSDISDEVTQALDYTPNQLPAEESAPDLPLGFEEDSKTVSYYAQSMGAEPVVGWLVCIEGKNFGKDYKLKTGRNFVGRAKSMDVAIEDDNTVSRERHAIVVYDPKTHIFLVQPGDSKELCYLNDQVVLTATKISLYDVLSLGATKLLFIPCCSDVFNWEKVNKEVE